MTITKVATEAQTRKWSRAQSEAEDGPVDAAI